jgi:RNA polymerase sigma-70 factor (ECF subfamily)
LQYQLLEAPMTSASSDTDALLKRATEGDHRAREQLLDHHRGRLRRMIAIRMDHRLQKRVDPSDIVQETLVIADRRLDEYLRQPPIPFYPWLRQLAWDQLVAFHRKHLYAGRRSRRREEDVVAALSDESVAELATSLVDESADPLSRIVRAELRQRVRRAIDQLPETYREILVLRHLEQLSTGETAAVLKIGASATKMRHLRAIERLKALLEDPAAEDSS